MKRLFLVLALAALALPQAGQAGWFRTYGGPYWDEGRSVQEIDGGYFITGFSYPYNSNQAALWLLKTDTLGDTVWSKIYGGVEELRGRGYFGIQTLDGGYIATGWKWTDSRQILLMKTDSEGDSLWTRAYGKGTGYCLHQDQDGGYVILGEKNSFPWLLFMLKTNSQGDSMWLRTHLLNGFVYGTGLFIEQTEDKGYIIAGLIGDTTEYEEKQAMWLLKTDSLGNILWSYTQGGDEWGDHDLARCVRDVGEGNYIALANFGLLKLNDSGDTFWTRDYQNGGSIDITYDDGYVLAGEAGGFNTASLCSILPQSLWLFKTDEQGDSLWKQTYKAGLSYYVKETRDSGFIVTGRDLTNGDLFLIKTDSLGLLGITENPIVESDNGWNVPHSIGSYVVLHYQGLPQGFRANVFDVSGRKVDQIRGDGNEGAMTWGITQPPGVYFIQALDNRNQLKTAKVVLVR